MFHKKSSQGTRMCHDLGSDRQKRNSALVSARFPLPSSPLRSDLSCPSLRAQAKPASAQPLEALPKSGLCTSKDKHFYLTSIQTNHIPLSHPGHQEIFEDTQAVSDHHLYQAGFKPVCAVFQTHGNQRFLPCLSQAIPPCNAFQVCRFYGLFFPLLTLTICVSLQHI